MVRVRGGVGVRVGVRVRVRAARLCPRGLVRGRVWTRERADP